jgi:hypothetical protein
MAKRRRANSGGSKPAARAALLLRADRLIGILCEGAQNPHPKIMRTSQRGELEKLGKPQSEIAAETNFAPRKRNFARPEAKVRQFCSTAM